MIPRTSPCIQQQRTCKTHRYGLRRGGWPLRVAGNGVEILQFAVGVCKENFRSPVCSTAPRSTFRSCPGGTTTGVAESLDCAKMLSETFGQAPSALRPPLTPGSVDLAKLEVHLSEPFSERNFIRNTALPESGTRCSMCSSRTIRPSLGAGQKEGP